MSKANLIPSSAGNPCPICDRTHDSDCRIGEGGNLVLCHTYQEADNIPGFVYVRRSDKGAGWGVWITEKPKKYERTSESKNNSFIYHDRNGVPLLKVQRKGRNFYQSTWDGSQWKAGATDDARAKVPVYRYSDVKRAIANDEPVFWVEGEGCADALHKIGICATTTIGGCKAYRNNGDYSQDLKGANLIICPDRDKMGIEYASQIYEDYPHAKWCRVFPHSPNWDRIAPSGGLDVVDWIADGATKEKILGNIENTAPWVKGKTQKSSKILDYNEALDQVDLLINSIDSESELFWAITEFSFANELNKRGLTGNKLLSLARARRDDKDAIQVEDAHDILESDDKIEFWITGHIPKGSTILLGGTGGTGKTSLCLSMAKAVALGNPWSGYRTHQGKVLFIQCDEPRRDTKKKLTIQKWQRDVPRGMVHFIRQWRFTQWGQLEKRIREEQYAMVVIDSWTSAHAGLGVEMTKSSAGDNIYKLRDVADETGTTFVIIHHLSKAGDFRDSSTLKDNVSEAWILKRPGPNDGYGNNRIILNIVKSRSDLRSDYLLAQHPKDYEWENLGDLNEADLPGERFYQKILSEMEDDAGTRYTAYEISKFFGIDYSKAENELQRLWKHGQVQCEYVAIANGDESDVKGRFYYWVDAKNIKSLEVKGNAMV